MYTGFKIVNINLNLIESYKNFGDTIFNEGFQKNQESLEDFKDKDGILNVKKIIEEWFPPVKADVFISHSHQDEEIALAFSGWLEKEHRVKCFIDSVVWKYFRDLQNKIDNKYCRIEGKNNLFSYEKINVSSVHVYTILTSALMKIIDATECFFFISTDNSLIKGNKINSTYSPWINLEILLSGLFKLKKPDRLKKLSAKKEVLLEQAMKLEYPVDLLHLSQIDFNNLYKDIRLNKKNSNEFLDLIYKTYGNV